MNICLLSTPTNFLEFNGFPPLPLLYLDSYLNDHGYTDIHIIDLNITNIIPEADIYAISATTPQFPDAIQLLSELKKLNSNPTTIIGGAHATSKPEDCKEFDKVIVGSGEIALIKCLKDIESKNNNKHIYTGEDIKNLDEIPIPSRQKIDSTKYKYYIDGELSTSQMTSRGCIFSCLFCQNSSKTDKTVRFHSNEYVLNEIQDIKNCGYRGIYFMDDMFAIRKDLLDLKSELSTLKWQCQIRADEKLNNIIKLGKMKCFRASMGLESGSQNILNLVNKRLNLSKVPEVIKECKKNDIKVHPYLILGLPSESHKSIEETIEFLRMIEPDSVGISTFVPYPGTYIHDHIEQFDIKIEDNDHKKWHFRGGNGGYNCIVSTSELAREDILKYREDIDREFN